MNIESATFLIHKMFEENQQISYEDVIKQWKHKYPDRMDIPKRHLFKYAKNEWRKKQAKKNSNQNGINLKVESKKKQTFIKKPIDPISTDNQIIDMLEKLELDLDTLVVKAIGLNNKEIESMIRNMRRLVSNRILKLEKIS